MFALRRLLVLTLTASLLASDLVTFWHIGDCGCKHESDEAPLAVHHTEFQADEPCHAGHGSCSHRGNPFAKRRAATSDASETIAANLDASSDAKSSPCQPDHDADDCSICRWLTLARDGHGFQVVPICRDLACVPSNTAVDRSQPALEPRFQELSRRGPPAQLLFS